MPQTTKIDKKELIRKAAIRVISENGYYNTKIAQIAEDAEIAVGTIYNYFASKQEILEYIFSVELEKRIKYLESLKEEDIPFWDKIDNFLAIHFKEVKNNLAIGKILVREKESPRTVNTGAIHSYMAEITDKIKDILEEAIDNDEIKESNVEIIATVFFGIVQGLVEKAVKNDKQDILTQAPKEIMRLLKEGLEK